MTQPELKVGQVYIDEEGMERYVTGKVSPKTSAVGVPAVGSLVDGEIFTTAQHEAAVAGVSNLPLESTASPVDKLPE